MVGVFARSLRLIVPVPVCIGALIVSSGIPRPAFATLSTCRSDPVVVLSNGATLDLQASIADSASDVSSVTYTVHVPKGTYVVSVLNTDGVLGLAEHIQVYSDSWPGSYTSTTLVSTRAPGVAVTAYATVVSALDIALGSKSVSGSAGQTLSITITSLL